MVLNYYSMSEINILGNKFNIRTEGDTCSQNTLAIRESLSTEMFKKQHWKLLSTYLITIKASINVKAVLNFKAVLHQVVTLIAILSKWIS